VAREKAMNRIDAWRMIQRRAAGLGMKVRIGCHTFRATGITAYLEAGGTLGERSGHGGARQSSTIELAMRSRSMRSSAGRHVPYLATGDLGSSGKINPQHYPIHRLIRSVSG
jgi:integrase